MPVRKNDKHIKGNKPSPKGNEYCGKYTGVPIYA